MPSGDAAPTLTGQLAAAELRSGDVLAGRFRIESMLGIGGMGVVYRAYDQSLDVDVAIKLLRPELARRPESFERFRQELLLARQVSSPHVVRIHDIAEHDGRWFISMDFVDGRFAGTAYRSRRQIAIDEALPITRGLLEGLTAAHGRGVVHRDLKPANVLLDKSNHAYITDFGVARSLGATGGMTQSGVIFGTPEYLSPEQARGEKVDARSDLYTVGLILYEMLSGTLPFTWWHAGRNRDAAHRAPAAFTGAGASGSAALAARTFAIVCSSSIRPIVLLGARSLARTGCAPRSTAPLNRRTVF